jgi:uncharacterized SAM-binding protein YcdF (DUF218 family)
MLVGGSRRRRLRWIAASALIAITAFCGATARLFIWPATGTPPQVDAVVVLGGQGSRLDYSLDFVNHGHTHWLLLSEGLPWIAPGLCGHRWPTLSVLCFKPVPDTTQGEAEYVARLARDHGWHSITLITTPDQAWRAELRFRRCFPGSVYAVTTPLPASQWPYAIGYQWVATIKAEVVNRNC